MDPYRSSDSSENTMALVALGLAMVSWVFGWLFLSIPAVIIAKMELGKIERGELDPQHRTLCQIAFWMGVVNIVTSILAVVSICCIYSGLIGMLAGGAALSG